MASGSDVLCQLVNLLHQFYSSTDSKRQKEIELILSQFSQQPDAWHQCLYFISNTSDEYVQMFCLNVLENVISCQWSSRSLDERTLIRSTVYELLIKNSSCHSPFVRNKMAKLVVYIARHDWPHHYSSFFTDVCSLVQYANTTTLGLILLHIASEELSCPRDDVVASRKEELFKLMIEQVPTFLVLLDGVLEVVIQKPAVVVVSSAAATSTHQSGVLRNSLEAKSSSTGPRLTLAPEVATMAHLALDCIAHIYSWTPLQTSAAVTPASLLEKVFHFATFGCRSSTECHDDLQTRVGEAALSCVNELVGKNQVPSNCEPFLFAIFSQTYSLLRCVVNSDASNPAVPSVHLSRLPPSYVDKFTEFLRLFVTLHLPRFENNAQFPLIDFLGLLFTYTFKQSSNEGFYNCLHIWSEFLDFLQNQMESRISCKDSCLSKYKDALVSMATELLRRLQFRYNQSQLEELDDDVLDDDNKTEWQIFLGECLEMMARISQFYPHVIFSLLLSSFHTNQQVYFGLEQYIHQAAASTTSTTSGEVPRRLHVTAEHDCRRLHCTLRDLSSLLQALGRLADHFTTDDVKFNSSFTDASLLVERLIDTAVYSSRLRLYETSCAVQDVLRPDFTEVHAQSLAAVKAYSSWLAQFYVQTRRDGCNLSTTQQCDAMIGNALDACVTLYSLHHAVPEKVLLSSAHLLMSLFTTVRPAQLYNVAIVQRLYADGITVTGCPREVEMLVIRSLAHYLLVPWAGGLSDPDQNWAERSARFTLLLQRTLHDYMMLSHQLLRMPSSNGDGRLGQSQTAALVQGKRCICRALSIVTSIVDMLGTDGISRSRQICYSSLQDCIDTAALLLSIYLQHSDVVDQLLGFFLAIFRCLRVQIGVPGTEKLIQLFMNLFTREQLQQTLQQENAAGQQTVDKFLKILQVIVLEPSASFRAFLPNILNICLYHIYPVIADTSLPDVKSTLYELLFQFVQHNWRYFFPRSVVISQSKSSTGDSTGEHVENRQQFVTIMQAFGQSFLQPDLTVFQQNLKALESLNTSHRLYHKEVMHSESVYAQLLTVLLQVLTQRSHALINDEILTAVYNMASVNFAAFYAGFLDQFLDSANVVDTRQKQLLSAVFHNEQDYPSFIRNLNRFVNDLRCYQLCNGVYHSS